MGIIDTLNHLLPNVYNGKVKLTLNPGPYPPVIPTTTIKPYKEHNYNPYSLHKIKPHYKDCSPGHWTKKKLVSSDKPSTY